MRPPLGDLTLELEELVVALRQHAQDRLAVGDVERDDPGFAVVGAFGWFGGFDELSFAEAVGETGGRLCRLLGSLRAT